MVHANVIAVMAIADEFVKTRVVPDPSFSVPAKVMNDALIEFFRSRLPERMKGAADSMNSASQLGKAMSRAGYKRTLTNGRSIYRGVRVVA